jgi:hypothetical protein
VELELAARGARDGLDARGDEHVALAAAIAWNAIRIVSSEEAQKRFTDAAGT